jgi:hypothetical protein
MADATAFRGNNPGLQGPIPSDLLTTSASGLGPGLSPASGLAQAERVARVWGVSRGEIEALVGRFLQRLDLGFIGERRMNVLSLHVAPGRDFPMRGKGDKRRVAGKAHDWQLHAAAAILGLVRRCRTNG